MEKVSRRLIVVAIVAVIALCGLSKTNGQTCGKWDLTGPFELEEDSGNVMLGRFKQNGAQLNGKGAYYDYRGGNDDGTLVRGSLDNGLVDGDRVTFHLIFESTGTVFTWLYEGTVADDGRVKGIHWDQGLPNGDRPRWHLRGAAKCVFRVGGAREVTQTSQSTAGQSQPASAGSVIRPSPSLFTSRLIPRLTCQTGYVWRATGDGDYACVPPESRTRAAQENKAASSRRLPSGECKEGFVWREAISDDHVCVTPEIRDLVREENRVALSRAVKP